MRAPRADMDEGGHTLSPKASTTQPDRSTPSGSYADRLSVEPSVGRPSPSVVSCCLGTKRVGLAAVVSGVAVILLASCTDSLPSRNAALDAADGEEFRSWDGTHAEPCRPWDDCYDSTPQGGRADSQHPGISAICRYDGRLGGDNKCGLGELDLRPARADAFEFDGVSPDAGSLDLSGATATHQPHEAELDRVEPDSLPAWDSELYDEFVALGPTGRTLGDFSHAGYHGDGREPPFVIGPVFEVAAFGALPGDSVDDTLALQAAVDAAGDAGGGVVQLAGGVYNLHTSESDPYLILDRDGVVLRGVGTQEVDGTTLLLGQPSREGLVRRLGTHHDHARSRAAVSIMGSDFTGEPICLTESTRRGTERIAVDSTAGVHEGSVYALELTDPGTGQLGRLLVGPFALSEETVEMRDLENIDWWVRVAGVDDGTHLTLQQPTRLDLDLALTPCFREVRPVREVGIEHLRISSAWPGGYRHHMPFPPYPADDTEIIRSAAEQDYLWVGVWVSRAIDSWIRDVVISDVTQSLIMVRAKNLAALELSIEGAPGHAGVVLAASHDVLVDGVHFGARRVHNVELLNWASGNVIRNVAALYEGWDPDSNTGPWVDGHGLGAHENLLEGFNGLYFRPGGDGSVLPHVGVGNVLWNFRLPDRMDYDPSLDGELFQSHAKGLTSDGAAQSSHELFPGTVVVGALRNHGEVTIRGSTDDRDDEWLRVEGLNRPGVQPESLYQTQRSLRLGR